jgi:outer membrane receptor protein involved in Fe transport
MIWQKIRSNFSKLILRYTLPLLFVVIFQNQFSFAQTGKLSGQITDENGEPLIGANVILEGTNLGAASDFDGYYSILNIRAGTYNVQYRYIGYQTKIMQGVSINADRTTSIDVTLSPEVITGEEVIVTAEKPLVEFNLTSSVSTIDKEEINSLPVQSLDEIVNLQAGVIDGHFRGGRLGEVQYQVDGVTVNNPYDNSSTLQLDRSIIEEVQVISGTFDAKYGQAMSGVVNAVLRSGSDKFEWSGEVYAGDYIPLDMGRYPYTNKLRPYSIQNYQLTLSGPTFFPQTTFFISGRRFQNNGHLYGERRFLPTDSSDINTLQFNPSGDRSVVEMNTNENWSGQFKVTSRYFEKIQLSYQAIFNDIETKRYSHSFRFNPEGIKTQNTLSLTHGLDFTHTLTDNMFYTLSARQNYFEYSDYKYEDLFDPRYLEAGAPISTPNYEDGAIVQGIDLGRFEQTTDARIGKVQFTWQVDRLNLVESGVEYQWAKVSFGSPGFITEVTLPGGGRVLLPRYGTLPEDPKVETYYPKQGAAYIQDRIEWGDIVVRSGLRFEFFDADAFIPSDLRNPASIIPGVPPSSLQKTTLKTSLAPRLGFSFPLTSQASVYFSYGHFYQMPNLREMYNNSNYLVLREIQAGESRYSTLGNPDLKPQKTIQYEVGLKQALTYFLGLQLTFFYKDIRDLLGVEFVTTYNAAEYTRFTNVDFGSAYGFTITLDQRAIGPISTKLDYTLQFANGNSSDPNETANRAAAGKDPRPRVIPFNWDQRNTLNATIVLFEPDNYSAGLIIKYGSGQPFTPALGTGFNADLETNSGRKPSFVLMDFRAEKFFSFGFIDFSLFLRVFNLLNTHTANNFVFDSSGSSDYSRFPFIDRVRLSDPSRFYEPRRAEIGISFRGL